MAITAADRQFWLSLRDGGEIPDRPAVLEIGQANWYGDADPAAIEGDVRKYADPDDAPTLLAALPGADPFELAEVFYRAVLRFGTIDAIDLHGTSRATPHDLNTPLPPELAGPYDVVINTGTAEHVFDQRRVFESIHDATADGGLMVHALPLWGWLDHGFVNHHPTLVADLACANGYEVVRWWLSDWTARRVVGVSGPADVHEYAKAHGTGGTAMHHVALRKRGREPFAVPQQGYYQGRLTPAMRADWRSMR